MKFALCNEMFLRWSLENQFDAFAAWGYDGAELAPFSLDPSFVSGDSKTTDVARILPAIRRRVQAASTASGVAVSGLHWVLANTSGLRLTTLDRAVRRRTADYLIALAELCAELGGSYLVFGSPAQRSILPEFTRADAEDSALETISLVLPTLERTGVTLALEALAPTETNFWTTADETLAFIEKLGSPEKVSLHLDCKAMAGGESASIPETIRAALGRRSAPTFHANDPNLRGPGFGDLDFAPILQALTDVGFNGWVGVEPFDYSPGVVTLGRESLRYLKSVAPPTVR
ncbi:MAG: sugar phosphate isomerase/epimerase [Thermoguttaceae bacterium]|nr:sugar phosphate isomerase/epimerase [Thermoguttaceae bacterium]